METRAESEVESEDVRVEIVSTDSGRQVLTRLCPYCGRFYQLSNAELKAKTTVIATDGRVLDDLHLVRCAGQSGLVDGVVPLPDPGVGTDRSRKSYNRRKLCPVCQRRYVWCHALKRKRSITLTDGLELDDYHRLKCARDKGLITEAQYRESARPSTRSGPLEDRLIWLAKGRATMKARREAMRREKGREGQ